MQSHHALDRRPRLAAALVVIVSLVCPRIGAGQAITSDGTLGTAVSNTGNAYTVNGGRSVGNNLFHSFGDFNVPTAGSATFNGPASTANVLSRVTGGQPSSIDGLISTRGGASPMPNANFFLINPAGVMFGPGASVDVGGTFHASSSDRIFLQDGVEFSATPGPGDALLSSAPPQAFGFLGSSAAITTDGTLGTVVDDDGADNYSISGGTYKGLNLFHSFSLFSVPEVGSAIFDGLPATENVISRVTGGSPSSIDNFISTRAGISPMPLANFFLINPAGVIFGPLAVLDVGGSVHFSTADQLIFPDRVFSAAPQPNELNLLSSALPQAFGFLADNPAGIDLNGAQLTFVDPEVAGRTLSLIGGDVTLRGAALLFAPGGRVQVVSVGSPGSVNFASPELGVSSFSRLGLVRIAENSIVVGGGSGFGFPGPGGSVVIRSGQLVVESGGWVLSDTTDFGAPPVGVDIQARDSVAVSGGGLIQTLSSGADDGSGISIATANLTMTGGGAILSQALATGGSGGIDIQVGNAAITGGSIQTLSEARSAGNIVLAATGTVTLSGPATEIASGNSAVDALAGNISVTAADIVLSDRAQIRSGSISQQAGEKVTVKATNTLSISGLAGILTRNFSLSGGLVDVSARQLVMDRGFITSSTFGARDAGPVIVNANTVSLVNGAQIASSSGLGNIGAAGSVTINAPGSVTISGVAPDLSVSDITFSGTSSSGVFSTAQGSGDAGQLSISTPQLTLANGARISVATTSTGDAGAIVANVGAFSITGGARVDSSTTDAGDGGSITINGDLSISGAGSGLFSTTSTGTGDAGAITVTGPALTLADGGRISVTTSGSGKAGTIRADVANVSITSGGQIDSSTSAGGTGGAITVNGTLAISGTGSGLFSTASSTGDAGAITVTGPSVTIADGGTIDSSSTGVGAIAGKGGAIDLTAASQISILNGGSIRADSLGPGRTGDVKLTAGDRIMMDNGSISTRAVTSDGGDIMLLAPNVIRLGNSQITTSVESGIGTGGNIFIDPQFVILQGSTITANAFGGPGGTVTIIADNFLSDATSIVSASSALSTPGTVTIQSPENNLKEAIAQLPGNLVDASRLLRGACSARQTGAPSSFAVAGRGGVPADADGYLSSFSTTGAPLARAARQEQHDQGVVLAMASLDCTR